MSELSSQNQQQPLSAEVTVDDLKMLLGEAVAVQHGLRKIIQANKAAIQLMSKRMLELDAQVKALTPEPEPDPTAPKVEP